MRAATPSRLLIRSPLLVAWLTVAVMAASAPCPAQQGPPPRPEPLFQSVGFPPAVVAARPVRGKGHARRERTVALRPAVVAHLEDRRDGAVRLELFEDAAWDADVQAVERRGPRRFSWVGRVRGVTRSQVVLTVEDGRMAGNVWVGPRLFQIRPGPNGGHVVREVDPSAFNPEVEPIGYDEPAPSGTEPQPPAAAAAEAGGPTIDVLVAYTATSAAAAGGAIGLEIQLAVDEANASYANSGIAHRLRLACTTEVAYPESRNLTIDRQRLSNPSDGFMDEVPPLRDSCGADLVSLWVEDGGGPCGLAQQMTDATTASPEVAYSVVPRACATGDLSFSHELGHLMGARHDWFVDIGTVPFPYSHGYLSLTGGWRTVMAYDTECTFRGTSCPRIPYWSNPNVLYPDPSGEPMGIPAGQSNPAHHQLTFATTAALVAGYRAPPAGGNQAPAAVADGYGVSEGGPLAVAAPGVLGNDTDPDGDPLTAQLQTPPARAASFTLNGDGSFTYTHDGSETTSDSFTYTAFDGALPSGPATVTLTITPANDAPVAVNDTGAVEEDGSLAVPAPGVLGNDTDAEGSALTAVLATGVSNGSLSLLADGSYSYTPNPDFHGTDSFTYRANDGAVNSDAAATVTITVNPVNDAPVATAGALAATEDQTAAGTLTATDVDLDSLTYSIVAQGTRGTAAITNPATGAYSYTPNPDANGPDSFTFKANDGTVDSNTATVSVTIAAVNDAPVLAAIGPRSVDETQALTVDLSASDVDGDPLAFGFSAAGPPGGGTLTDAGNGTATWRWTPALGDRGDHPVTFQVADGQTPALTDTELVTVTVTAPAMTVAVPLRAGWNLISHPLATCSYLQGAPVPTVALPVGVTCSPVASIEAALPGIAGSYDRIRSFDADGVHHHDPSLPAHLNDLTYVAGGYGYWVRMTQPGTVTFSGPRLDPAATLSLPTGWTLAGYWGPGVRHVGPPPPASYFPPGVAFSPVVSIAEVFTSLGPAAAAVLGFDAAGDHAYDPALSEAENTLDYLGPGYGYWFKVDQAAPLGFDLP